MKDLLSPGSLVTVGGGVLTVVGGVAYATGSANLSLPTIFYGIPILLGGLALKSSELPPARRVTPKTQLKAEREQAAPELGKLLGDVTRWRYGQKAHLESSLEASPSFSNNFEIHFQLKFFRILAGSTRYRPEAHRARQASMWRMCYVFRIQFS